MSHFVASLTVAIVLYLNSRPLWGAFMRRWLVLTALTLVTYFIYPAAPPWWGSRFGYIPEHIERMSGRGWEAIGLDGAGKLLAIGQSLSNPTAAMPSLHSGWAALIIAFFLPRVRKRWWPLLLTYPVAMTLTLMYTGDHYFVDVLVAWSYVGVSFALVSWGERWWERRRARALPVEVPVSPAPAPRELAGATKLSA
jgi:hypothetical protein